MLPLLNMNNNLFSFSKYCGCAAKLDSNTLKKVISKIQNRKKLNLLIGFENYDDCGVFRINHDHAILSTVDINTPMVKDGYIFGQIAACNSLSDIYAMGGEPLTCLNILGYPDHLDLKTTKEILEGALDKINESEACLLGGHTMKNEQLFFGLSVNGIINPNDIWTNKDAQSGDLLILTKPIGLGVLFSANKKNKLSKSGFQKCLKYATTLNKYAYLVMKDYNINSVTDVAGFGLLGHVLEIARASKKTIALNLESIPVIKEAIKMYENGIDTSITKLNIKNTINDTNINENIDKSIIKLLADPQTNGGLLFSLPKKEANRCLGQLHKKGLTEATIIGSVTEFSKKHILV
ncbi:MAG: selenide, water dikinase SelD [Candidatus Atribacteria bacterium]|nr:MAG: selenide, water dikinase SelD [Candidatus Atribacteria bacterium]